MTAEGAHYQVLARKWRPQRFEDVVGQEHVTRTLRNAIAAGRIHHAFLFIGSRGIGKTTTARILAKALNCLESGQPTPDPCGRCANCASIGQGTNMDVIEIDGASNNGVENVREIREHIRMVPTHGRYKIYIIDEVHQLSAGAFNALLKTLEEPPPHGVFILATTEAHRIPATIVSRCQRLDFRRVAPDRIVDLLRTVCEKEGRKAGPGALEAIARAAEGGVRDAESILDQLMSFCEGEIRFEDVYDVLGLVDHRVLSGLCDAIVEKDIARQLAIVADVVAAGKDLSQFVQELLQHVRNLVVAKVGSGATLLELPQDARDTVEEQAAAFTLTQLIRLVEQFAELGKGFDSQVAQRIALEALLIRLSKTGVDMTVDAVMEKLLGLGIAAGGRAPDPPEAGAPPSPRRAQPAGGQGVASPPARRKAAERSPSRSGPDGDSAPEPKPAARLALTADNLRELWPGVVNRVRQEKLAVGVWLARARPADVDVDEGKVSLRFPEGSAQARDTVEDPQARELIERVLCALFDNVRTFDTGFDAAAEPEPAAQEALDPNKPYYPRVNPKAAERVLEDPAVALVLDVFKGRIADVKRPSTDSA